MTESGVSPVPRQPPHSKTLRKFERGVSVAKRLGVRRVRGRGGAHAALGNGEPEHPKHSTFNAPNVPPWSFEVECRLLRLFQTGRLKIEANLLCCAARPDCGLKHCPGALRDLAARRRRNPQARTPSLHHFWKLSNFQPDGWTAIEGWRRRIRTGR